LLSVLKDHIISLLRKNLDHTPTKSQIRLIDQLGAYIVSREDMEVLLVKGYAGTGKTSMVKSIVTTLDQFRLRYVLLAPTGRAAKVLSSYADRPAYTIHKRIYRQKTAKEGIGEFVLNKNLQASTVFIVDEASMITNQSQEVAHFGSGKLLEDLVEYVYTQPGCKLILIGDTAQLPPVGLSISPALEPAILASYDLKTRESFLEDVIRQSIGSGILHNATLLRKDLAGERFDKPGFQLDGFNDIHRISGEYLLEEISNSYSRYGMGGKAIITRSNKRANRFNNAIRSQVLYKDEEISKGDQLMIVRNNYYWNDEEETIDFIANGDTAEVVKITGFEERYGFHFALAELKFPDYGDIQVQARIILDALSTETASLTADDGRLLYNNIADDYPGLKSRKKKYEKIREHPYFNALQVKFAYAVTCHKAQGGQWKNVFVDQGYIPREMIDRDYYRWLYTAVTRATEKLYLINFPEDYFIT